MAPAWLDSFAIDRRRAELVQRQRQSQLLEQQQSLIAVTTQPEPISLTTQQEVDLFIGFIDASQACLWDGSKCPKYCCNGCNSVFLIYQSLKLFLKVSAVSL